MNPINDKGLISLHGGHSGQFCNHAKDSLEEVILGYLDRGFTRVGISEHMPMPDDDLLYPDEKGKGLTADKMLENFARYFKELERLQKKFQDRITIYKGFETETVTGWQERAADLIRRFRPDYVVGSVHHVHDVCFDYAPESREGLVRDLGSEEALYLAYFDAQHEMLKILQPFVVGHFDIIRIYDPDFEERMKTPEIRKRIERNLDLIASLGLNLDYNLRPLARGEAQPYLAPMILDMARDRGIAVIPGDDSHSRAQAGAFVADAVENLAALGFSTQWPEPWCRPIKDD